MAQDPFVTDQEPVDEFSQPAGGGKYPNIKELIGALVLIAPIKIETVPAYQDPTKTSERLTADVVILDGDRVGEEYSGMWINNIPVVREGETALRTRRPMVLGRLRRFPQSKDRQSGKYTSWQDIEAAIANWRPGNGEINYAIGLDKYTDDDAAVARAWLKANR